MKTTITKITAILLTIMLSSYFAFSQQIVTTAPTLNISPGTTTVAVPITVQNLNGVASISLTLGYPLSSMTYVSFTGHPALASGMTMVNSSGGKVIAAWFATSPASIPDGETLITFNFSCTCDQSPLIWDIITPGNCQYSDLNGNIMPATFIDGAVSCETAPVFSQHPASITVTSGDPAVFDVIVTPANLQWQESNDGGMSWINLTEGAPYSGVTTTTLTINPTSTAMSGYQYHCVATTPIALLTAVSDPATLTVSGGCPLPLAFNVTGGGSYCVGASGLEVNLDNSEADATYELFLEGITTGIIVPGTGSPIGFGLQTVAGTYSIVGTNSCGSTTMTGDAEIVVRPLPMVIFSGTFPNLCENEQFFPMFGGSPAGGTYSGNGVTGTHFNPSYAGVGTHILTYTYTDGNNCTNSATNTIQVNPLPNVYFEPQIPSTCIGGSQVSLAQGHPIGGTYSGTGVSAGYFDPNLAGAGTHVIIYTYNDAVTGCENSAAQSVTVGELPLAYELTGGGNVCPGSAGRTLTLNGSETGINYTLYFNGAQTADVLTGTGSALEFGPYNVNGYYNVFAEDPITGCSLFMNDTQYIFNNPTLNITVNPVDVVINDGGNTSFMASGDIATGYQWQLSTDGGAVFTDLTNGTPYSGVTTENLILTGVTYSMNSYQYRCRLTEIGCNQEVFSTAALLTVNQLLAINTIAPVITNASPGPVVVPITVENMVGVASMGLTLNYDNSILTYTGYQNQNPQFASGMLLINNLGNQVKLGWFSVTPININTGILVEYLFNYTGGNGVFEWSTTPGDNGYSNLGGDNLPAIFIDGSISGCILPIVYNLTGGGYICTGGTGIEIGIDNSEISTEYTLYLDGISTGITVAGNDAPVSFGVFTTAGTYTAVAYNTCGDIDMLGTAVITEGSLPTVFEISGNGNICPGSYSSVTLSGSEIGVDYALFIDGTWVNTTPGTGNPFTLGSLNAQGTYTMSATNIITNCSTMMSGSATLYTEPTLEVTQNPVDVAIYEGFDAEFVIGGMWATSCQWQVSTDGGLSFINLTEVAPYSGVTTPELDITNASASLNGNLYRCRLSESVCNQEAFTTAATLNILTNITINTYAPIISGALPGQVIIPITVENLNNVAAISLTLQYDLSIMSYVGYQNVNSGLSTGSLAVNGTGNLAQLAWFSTTPVSIPDGVLFELVFDYTGGFGLFTWSVDVTDNQYSNVNAFILPANFVPGSIDGGCPLPTAFSVTGGGNYCIGGTGVPVGLSNSETGVNYELFLDGVTTGTIIAGDGNPLDFGLQTSAGVFTINGTNICGTVLMDASSTISIDPLPAIYDVTGGGNYCIGGAGVSVGLTNSETGVNYELFLDGVNTGTIIAGDGNPLDFGLQTSAGVYTISGTNICGTVQMDASATISIDPLPVVYIVTGGGNYCAGGTGVAVGLTGSETGVTYDLYYNGVATVSSLTGTGSALDFGLQTASGDYTIVGTNPCGSINMEGNVSIVINNIPIVYNVSGGGSYCIGGPGVDINLSGSETGALYELYLDNVATGIVLSGTGNSLTFVNNTTAGNYTIVATNNCGSTNMNSSTIISIEPLPGIFNIIGGGSYCPGGTGVNIGIDGSESGVNYTLYQNGVTSVLTVSGNGSAFSFGIYTASGTYTIIAENSCGTQNMNGTATVTIGNTLTFFNVTGGGTYLAGGSGLAVGLDGSQLNVNYELLFNGSSTGITLNGTGSALDFGNQTAAGTYTIMATDPYSNCIAIMAGGATIIITPIIITNPMDISIYEGWDGSFTVSALSATIFQWQVSTNGGSTFTNITPSPYYNGINSNTLFITGAPITWNGYKYQCLVSNPGSPIVTSNAATLTVVNVPAVVTISPTMTSAAGSNIAIPINVINFNNIAAMAWTLNYDPNVLTYTGYQNVHPQLNSPGMMLIANNTSGTFHLQWFSLVPANVGNTTIIELLFDYNCGYSSFIWETTPAEACQYGNILANPVPSTWINGSINCSTSLVITDQPDNYTTCEGGNASFTIGTSPAATTYQWMVSTDFGATWMDLTNSALYSGVNTTTLTVSGAVTSMSSFLYACKVDEGLSTAAVSNPASIILVPFIIANADIIANPGTIICPGTSVTFSVSSIYPFTGATFNWLINGIDVGSGLTYTTSTLSSGDVVNVNIIDPANCVVANVTPLTMIVDPHPIVTTNPVDVIAVVGDVVTYTVTATGADLYQWQESTDGGLSYSNLTDGGLYSGTATATLTISGVTLPMDQNLYRCVLTESLCGNTTTSLAALLHVFPAPVYTYLPTVANCTGYQVVIPITVDNFIQVASGSLKFDFDPSVLNYVSYQNVNPALTIDPSSMVSINNTGSQINFFWYSLSPVTIANGDVLFEVVFTYGTPGTSNLTWDLGLGNTQYTNLAGIIMPAFFIDGNATSNPLPIVFDITGGGEYCIGGPGVEVGLDGSELGVNYELFLDGVSTGIIVAGTGLPISFGLQIPSGIYTAIATNVSTLCFNNMNGSAEVIINPLPIVTWTNILEDVCEEVVDLVLTGGMPLGGTYSGPGVSNNIFNAAVAGPGTHTLTYTYTDENGCINSATNTITVIDGPTPFQITGGGTFCQGGIGVEIGLTTSEPAIVYQLFINGINSGSPVFGTGSVINFGYQNIPGTYTVVGLNIFTGCAQLMIGSVTVTEIIPNVTWTWSSTDTICENSSPFALSGGLPAGGTYSGNGVIGNVFHPFMAGNGVHVLTYSYTDSYGCTGSASVSIAVVPGTQATFDPISDVCVNSPVIQLSSYITPVGGTFTGPGVTGSTFNPSAAGVGTHTITYALEANSCTVNITRNINVLPIPVVNWTNILDPQCIDQVAYLLSGATPVGGIYSGTAVSNGVFNPSLAGTGTFTLTYSYTDANGCTNSATNTITVNDLPLVTWANSLPNQCNTSTSFVLTGGLPTGGTYSGTGVSGNIFNASILSIGTYVLTYTYTDLNGCTNSATNTINVSPVPDVTFDPLPDVCSNVSSILLTSYASPVGGTFSGNGVVGNTFVPTVAGGVGTYTITYTYQNAEGCSATANRNITVTGATTISWTNTLTPQCENSTSYFIGGATPAGGLYSGPGVTGNIFNASLAGAGTHTITYTFTNPAGCISTATNTITVNPLPLMTWTTVLTDQCISDNLFTLSGATPTGGTYTGAGVSGSNFNASLAGIGIHTITYTYTDVNECTNSITNTISVYNAPAPVFGQLPTLCANDAPINLSLYVTPTGGIFAGTGVSGNIFDPATTGVGVYSISYTVTIGGCSTTVSRNIEVVGATPASWTNSLTPQCEESTSYFLTGGTPAGGVYSGSGVTGNIFNASIAGNGTHILTYTFTNANGCVSTVTNTITVYSEPTVIWNTILPATCESSPIIILTGATPAGGTYSGPGVSGSSFNPTLAGVGIYTLTYTYTDPSGNNCTGYATNTITVNPSPVATLMPLPTVCIDGGVVVLSNYGIPVGGTFSGIGVTANVFNPATAGVGTHTITYTVSNSYGCTSTSISTITVLPAPVVTWTTTLTTQCINSNPITLTGGMPTGGTYSGPGVLNGQFYPTIAGQGTFTLTYTYQDINGCENSANNSITVNLLPPVIWTTSITPLCIDSPVLNLTTTGATPAGGTFTGAGVVGTNFNPALAGVGAHVITYTYTTTSGCTSSATNVVIVNPLPPVSFSGVLGPLCENSNTYALTTGVPVGGTYSGLGVTGNNFNASVAGVGTHTLTYTYTSANGCTASATNSITVNALPVVSWPTVLPTLCANVTSFQLSGATPPGGTYYGPGVYGSVFNPSIAGVGTHTLTYTYTDMNGCTNSVTNTIVVSVMPIVTLGPDKSICYGDSVEIIPVTIPATGLTYAWNTGEVTPTIWVTAVDTSTYCVTVTNAFGCAATDCIVIESLPLPIAYAGPNQTICYGEFATFTGHGGAGPDAWQWSTGSTSQVITVTANDTTTYTLTVTNLDGCHDTATVTLNVNPIPHVTLGPDQSICENMSVTLMPIPVNPLLQPSNYLWNTGLENQPLVADSTGYGLNNPTTFTVTVTLNGCANDTSVVVTWVPCPGIDELSNIEIINVYPNPTNGRFTVTIENVDNALTLDIYNNIGQHLYTRKLNNNGVSKYTKEFDLTDYPMGIYFLRFSDGDKFISKKLIVN